MGLKAFFAMRFIAIAAISLITHYIVLPLIATGIPLPTGIQQPLWWLITGVSTILIMISAYKSLKAKPIDNHENVHSLSDFGSPSEVFAEVERQHKKFRTPLDDWPKDTTIKELGTEKVTAPEKKRRKPSKREIERTIYLKLLDRIAHAPINVSAKVAKNGEDKLEITKLEATLDTENQPPQKPWRPRTMRRGG